MFYIWCSLLTHRPKKVNKHHSENTHIPTPQGNITMNCKESVIKRNLKCIQRRETHYIKELIIRNISDFLWEMKYARRQLYNIFKVLNLYSVNVEFYIHEKLFFTNEGKIKTFPETPKLSVFIVRRPSL